LDSSSATRFLSSTNWSSKYLSRSVIGAGASTVDGAGFAGALLALLSVFVSGLVSGFVSAFVPGLPSSAKERYGTATIPVNVRNKTQERIHPFTSAAISLSCCLTDKWNFALRGRNPTYVTPSLQLAKDTLLPANANTGAVAPFSKLCEKSLVGVVPPAARRLAS
jgi:hypothetical protein